ncbi:MAG: hypothetical protein ACQESR_04060 [Planctomycetota bacterium]
MTNIEDTKPATTSRAGGLSKALVKGPVIPVADDFLRRESDQREDGLRGAAFYPEKSNRLKYN